MPPTEARGRVHTSTITVVVLNDDGNGAPSATCEDEFRIEFVKGSGAGGQHRNKHATSVRMTHIPTGLTQIRQSRERETNLREARAGLEAAIRARRDREKKTALDAVRRQQAGSGERGDKFRTYRLQDDRVTDDRNGRRASANEVLGRGRFELLWR